MNELTDLREQNANLLNQLEALKARNEELERKLGYRQGIAHGFKYEDLETQLSTAKAENERYRKALNEIMEEIEYDSDNHRVYFKLARQALALSRGEAK